MKTPKQAASNSGIPLRLINAVIRQLGGKDSLSDIARHGIDGGFSGFCYYTETVSFFKRNRTDITEAVKQMADSLGESPLAMVSGFRCLQPVDEDTKESIGRCVYGGRLTEDDTQVANALAWFAGEEVARAMTDR